MLYPWVEIPNTHNCYFFYKFGYKFYLALTAIASD